MKIDLTEAEVHEILLTWARTKMPWLGEAKITVHQLYYEGVLAAAIEIDTTPAQGLDSTK